MELRVECRTSYVKAHVTTFLNELGEDYCRANRYDSALLVSSFRSFLALRAVSCSFTDANIFRLISEKLCFVFDMKADYEYYKGKLGLNDVEVSKLFCYPSAGSFYSSVRKTQHITHFLNMARLFCK